MKISVIGAAGCIGSSIAFCIADRGLADELVMADIRQDWLEHHAIDVYDAATVKNIEINVRMGRHADIAGSDIVIMAAGARAAARATTDNVRPSSRQRLLPENLEIIKEWAQTINRYCPQAIVITATNPAEVLNYANYRLSSTGERSRFIGYSLNDTTRFRIATARLKGISPAKVDAMVMGEHGGSMVSLFSSVRVDGKPVIFTRTEQARILEKTNDYLPHMLRLNVPRTSGWLTGVGIAKLVNAIINDTGEVIPCCAVLDGEYGYKDISIGVPVKLGRQGISEIIKYELPAEEKELLDVSVKNIQPSIDYVKQKI
jgi:malate dehydrogenase